MQWRLTQVVCLRVLGLAVARTVCNCVPQMRKLVHWGIRRFTLDLERVTSVYTASGAAGGPRAEHPTHYFDNVHCGHTARQERDAYGCHRVSCHRVPPSAYGCLPPSATECHRVPSICLWACHRVHMVATEPMVMPPSATQPTNVVEWCMPSAIIARLVGEGRIRARDRWRAACSTRPRTRTRPR